MSMWDSNSHEKETKHFDICTPKQSAGRVLLKSSLFARNREKRKEMKQSDKEIVLLRPGMVHLKGYISLTDQVKIVKVCRELGLGDGGFYQPGYKDGTKLHLKMMCLGKNWDPQTRQYGCQRLSDGSVSPKIPDEFLTLVHSVIKDSHSLIEPASSKPLPVISPDICIVNFYEKNGRLGLHQYKDESDERMPVVSFSIGDPAEFLYGDERDVDKAKKVVLESGDILIFGGKARNVFHGISAIKPDTAPSRLLEETNLCKPGRLELSFIKLVSGLGQGSPFSHGLLTPPPPPLFPQIATRWISWHPSREDCFVLNVDGSCLGDSGRAGAGGLIRKGDGSWVIGFSCFLGIADNNYA
ncbi:alpha-ketoglutarate-dependent dioxygenase abh1-like [Vicia villosa]|uniref:alpha-ketoglutarate-dependent dioxygenase abh1-like n=1 Tax=Vicia villosa TaxID=3911 RepID=UPI00273B1B52|nr:alpha-ketoglutarate-dependent dioxygenase abh1-like [Vicia villosa]